MPLGEYTSLARRPRMESLEPPPRKARDDLLAGGWLGGCLRSILYAIHKAINNRLP